MLTYLAIDPGDVTGWAAFDEKGDIITLGQVEDSEFSSWARQVINPRLKAIICEDYRIMSQKAQSHSWSRVPTIKKIGVIEDNAAFHGVKVILQPNNAKSTGYAWGGITAPSNHGISHQYDAYAHGVYYLQKSGVRKPGQGLNLEKA